MGRASRRKKQRKVLADILNSDNKPSRKLTIDYEVLRKTAEAFIYVAMVFPYGQ